MVRKEEDDDALFSWLPESFSDFTGNIVKNPQWGLTKKNLQIVSINSIFQQSTKKHAGQRICRDWNDWFYQTSSLKISSTRMWVVNVGQQSWWSADTMWPHVFSSQWFFSHLLVNYFPTNLLMLSSLVMGRTMSKVWCSIVQSQE